MQILRLCLRPTESETLRQGPGIWIFNKPSSHPRDSDACWNLRATVTVKGEGIPTSPPPLTSSVCDLRTATSPSQPRCTLQNALSQCQCLKCSWPSINGRPFSLGYCPLSLEAALVSQKEDWPRFQGWRIHLPFGGILDKSHSIEFVNNY
ncbi:hypothetical protein mRhiFer1_010189 [Rhinolophus ferrumequinum]|uniref:Uncharacterized protein n=1 Tax=Rhinolophus ferrumequinum TaxID=59479 RepID=A0A7J7XPL7_RHIFE|nr:hypothetical protein mRhiFer1_010189 [Rhinolophus ferrumequinum]